MANEKRLIDANAYAYPGDLINEPTIDAVEVVHGRWRFRKNWDFFVCSECSYESSNYSNYCPNCGAKMDGGNEDG